MKNTSNITKPLARLARNDINIFNLHKEGDAWVVEYEYGWQPTDYKTKWTKAIYISDGACELGQLLEEVRVQVSLIREELER